MSIPPRSCSIRPVPPAQTASSQNAISRKCTALNSLPSQRRHQICSSPARISPRPVACVHLWFEVWHPNLYDRWDRHCRKLRSRRISVSFILLPAGPQSGRRRRRALKSKWAWTWSYYRPTKFGWFFNLHWRSVKAHSYKGAARCTFQETVCVWGICSNALRQRLTEKRQVHDQEHQSCFLLAVKTSLIGLIVTKPIGLLPGSRHFVLLMVWRYGQ